MFVEVETGERVWRKPNHQSDGTLQPVLPRGAGWAIVLTPNRKYETGGYAIEWGLLSKAGSLVKVVETIYRADVASGRKVSPQPEQNDKGKLKLKGRTLRAVVWRWVGRHPSGQDTMTVAAACQIGEACLLLRSWEVLGSSGVVRAGAGRENVFVRTGRPLVRSFKAAGVFGELKRAVRFVPRVKPARRARVKLTRVLGKCRHYVGARLPRGFVQSGGPHPEDSDAVFVRMDSKTGALRTRLLIRRRKGFDSLAAVSASAVAAMGADKEAAIGPVAVEADGLKGVLVGHLESNEGSTEPRATVRRALFLAHEDVWEWSLRTTATGPDLKRELRDLKSILKTARIWWRFPD